MSWRSGCQCRCAGRRRRAGTPRGQRFSFSDGEALGAEGLGIGEAVGAPVHGEDVHEDRVAARQRHGAEWHGALGPASDHVRGREEAHRLLEHHERGRQARQILHRRRAPAEHRARLGGEPVVDLGVAPEEIEARRAKARWRVVSWPGRGTGSPLRRCHTRTPAPPLPSHARRIRRFAHAVAGSVRRRAASTSVDSSTSRRGRRPGEGARR